MTRWQVVYNIWSSFFNAPVQFSKVVETKTEQEAIDRIKKENPLAEAISVVGTVGEQV